MTGERDRGGERDRARYTLYIEREREKERRQRQRKADTRYTHEASLYLRYFPCANQGCQSNELKIKFCSRFLHVIILTWRVAIVPKPVTDAIPPQANAAMEAAGFNKGFYR